MAEALTCLVHIDQIAGGAKIFQPQQTTEEVEDHTEVVASVRTKDHVITKDDQTNENTNHEEKVEALNLRTSPSNLNE